MLSQVVQKYYTTQQAVVNNSPTGIYWIPRFHLVGYKRRQETHQCYGDGLNRTLKMECERNKSKVGDSVKFCYVFIRTIILGGHFQPSSLDVMDSSDIPTLA